MVEDGCLRAQRQDHSFELGPTASEAAITYLAAYQAGDCEAQLWYLSDDAWSAHGALGRDEFLAECESSAIELPAFFDELSRPVTVEGAAADGGREVAVDWWNGGPDERSTKVSPSWSSPTVPLSSGRRATAWSRP